MQDGDWNDVAAIFKEGIASGNANYTNTVPNFEEWNAGHIEKCRFVATIDGKVAGWAALSPTSSREVFSGVVEVSIYIAKSCRGNGIGEILLNHIIAESEKAGIWTVQAYIFEENLPSLKLHEKCGFYKVGVRKNMAKDFKGRWRNNVLLERRSSKAGID